MANYVKFFRGTPEAFEKLTSKNSDTLYFISSTDSSEGSLYLGDKLIIGGVSSITDLKDIAFTDLDNGDVLVYNNELKKWVNKSIYSAIGVMGGTDGNNQGEPGLVPAPGVNDKDLFLRGDGTWAAPETTIEADHNSIELLEDGITLSLKNFGKQYYRHGENEGEYILQVVDEEHPWIAGLEPRVVEEDGQLVLGWYQPSSTTIEGVSSQLATLSTKVDTLDTAVTNLGDLVKDKANAEEVYTKNETDEAIATAILNSNHLTRQKFNTLAEAEAFATEKGEKASNYVYMIPSEEEDEEEDNKYLEYLYIDGALELVGTWKVNLSGYATIDQLDLFVKKVDGYGLISDSDLEKLAGIEEGAEKNLFDSVDGSMLKIDENKQLTIDQIAIDKVTNLSTALSNLNDKIDGKASTAELQAINGELTTVKESVNTLTTTVGTLSTTVETLSSDLSILSNAVGNLSDNLNDNFVTKTVYNEFVENVENSIVWHELI